MKFFQKPTAWIPLIPLLVYVLLVFLFPSFVRDNGENFRFLTENGMYRSGDFGYGFSPEFTFLSKTPFSFLSTLAGAVIGLWYGVFGFLIFDIRLLSLIYVVVTVFALWLIARELQFRSTLANTIAGVLLVLLATSYGLFSYFNTWYREGAVLPLLLLSFATFLRFTSSKSSWFLLLFFLSAVGFVTIGPGTALTALAFMGCFIRLAFLPISVIKRILTVVFSFLMIPTSILGFASMSPAEAQETSYNAVFYGALSKTEDVKAALLDLGLKKSLAEYAQKPYFEVTDFEPLRKDFYPHFSYGKLAGYYLKHPKTVISILKSTGNNVYETNIAYLRCYDEDITSVQKLLSAPTRLYETLKLRFLPRGVLFWVIYLMIFIILACVRRKTLEGDGEKARNDCSLFLAVTPLLTLMATPFVSGMAEISKRLFYTNALFELFFFVLLCYAIECIILRRNRLREKYGVNQ